MITIYHNPRCRKSRQGLAVLEDSGKEFEMKRYLDNPLSVSELREVISKLNIKPIELVRKQEAIWKADFKDKDLSDDELIKVMTEHPKLIERPIVVMNDNAVVGRPSESISQLLKD